MLQKSGAPSIDDAIRFVRDRFPIVGYMTTSKSGGAYATIAATAVRYLQPGARILDSGCGPCDKTAILQRLGDRCSGYDDLQEDWHNDPGQRDQIICFATDSGIDFQLANGTGLPFAHEEFAALSYGFLTVVIATVSWYAFERPINRLKKKFPYPATSSQEQARRSSA